MPFLKSHRRLAFVALVLSGFVSGCDMGDLFDESHPAPLPGKRISVLTQETDVAPDRTTDKSQHIVLPPPDPNADWPQVGGNSTHAMHHLTVSKHLHEAWTVSIGEGGDKRTKLLSTPVIAGGRLYVIDTENVVSALSLKTGEVLWRVNVTPREAEAAPASGALAYEDGRLFVVTGYAQVMALNAANGKGLWRQTVSGPVRGAPAVRAGHVVVITVDDHAYCLRAKDGQTLWTHQGTVEAASLMGGNTAAIDGNMVIVPYASGELFALRIDNGAVLWQDSVANIRKIQGVSLLTAISARPISDRGKIFAMGHADVLAAIDQRSGRRLWERDIGGIQSPWVAGDYLFAITNANEAVAIDAKTGRLLWVTQLRTWEDEAGKKDRVVWAGPVLASNRLIVGSSLGQLVTLSPYTGEILGNTEVSDGISLPPVVAGDTLYVLTDAGDLIAYR